MVALQETYVLAIDQGTSGTMVSLYDHQGQMVAFVDRKIRSFLPQPGWVEQDPAELLDSIYSAFSQLIRETHLKPGQIECLGLANQGESLVLWDLDSGKPIYNVIGWQCIRSLDLCERLKNSGFEMDFLQKTGLPIDPEWPATKIPWTMENIPGIRQLARSGRLVYSQLDTWFIHQLTREKKVITDYSTASRSGFYNIHNLSWDEELIGMFHADNLIFPKVVDSSGDFGLVDFGDGWFIPWRGGCLDQAAALLGQGCIHPGDTKITYGTCVGFWHNLGPRPVETRQLSTSIAWVINGNPTYAVAGEMNTAAAALEWLREKILLGWSYDDLSTKAQAVAEDEGLVFITALNGLGAPYWAPHVRGTLYGLTTSSGPEHIARACLEAIAFSVRDMSTALENERGIIMSGKLIADGGMTANEYLMQFQAEILGKQIILPANNEGTSTGVAILAGISNGFYAGLESNQKSWEIRNIFAPHMPETIREQKYHRWRELLEHSMAAYPRPV